MYIPYCPPSDISNLLCTSTTSVEMLTVSSLQQVKPGSFEGVVLRPMKSSDSPVSSCCLVNPKILSIQLFLSSLPPSLPPSLPQMDYEGAIKPSSPPDSGRSSPFPQELPYSITSITDHRISLQEGDQVRVHHRHEICAASVKYRHLIHVLNTTPPQWTPASRAQGGQHHLAQGVHPRED